MKRNALALLLLSALTLGLLAACGGADPTATPVPTAAPTDVPTTAPTNAPATATTAVNDAQAPAICGKGITPDFIKQVVLAKDVSGANFDPVDITAQYTSDQKIFHAITTLENAPNNTTLRAIWYLVNAAGYAPNSKIAATEMSNSDGGSHTVDLQLKPKGEKWPIGAYCVEIYVDNTLALSKTFNVVGGNATVPPNDNPIKQVVLAKDIKPDTFEPINPTTTFKTNATFIHATVQIAHAAPNTVFKARWYPPTQGPTDFEVSVDGTRWVDFRLTPGSNGFPAGDYKVEIYANDKLLQTETFKVQ